MDDLYLIAVNLTRRCNLRCAHCYLDASTLEHGSQDELSTEQVCRLLDQVAQRNCETMVVLTGGEPLLRRDLEAFVAHGRQRGLFMVIGTNGVLLDDKRVHSLQTAGVMGIGISLDSLDPHHHDEFRGCPGAWQKTLEGMESCRRHGLPFQIHFSVTQDNAHEVGAMIDFARACRANVLNFFFLVCTGRGQALTDISPDTYERVLHQLLEAQEDSQDLIIRARCAPHFQRVAHQRDPDSPLTRSMGYDGSSCIAGTHYCRVTPEGGITACPYIPDEVDSIRAKDFLAIWDHNPVLQQLRAPRLQGKCGQCEYRRLCGGCRARALALEGDLMSADTWCGYLPRENEVVQPSTERLSAIHWSPAAKQRLSHIPAFLRGMIKRRAESFARQRGEREVTAEHLRTLARHRFGDAGPPAVAGSDEASCSSVGKHPRQEQDT